MEGEEKATQRRGLPRIVAGGESILQQFPKTPFEGVICILQL
ncbi:hypothetical protein DSM3645_00725 [Blastopirellula marina DSM 3645]|uniref:Uncharacterized protein n=1 Tax=Blastopirellula marina DSM 3645 TaxID=314230 RepID=A3ZMM0_9BACT|nr:hypothetical protein DSM3645_00725 [Blastopirellula marina DSM 3645]